MTAARESRTSDDSVEPIFLLSLPRSGSTLVQRVLSSHPDVATAAEPWLLLPHAYALRERGIATDYTQPVAARAIREFVSGLPGGEDDYWIALRRFALEIYGEAAGGKRYFLDKTPRYHHILPELDRLFPAAPRIYLWRNPLAVVSSICETWTRNRWTVDRWRNDLDGLASLIDGFAASPSAISVRYESLVREPDEAWPALFDALGLTFDPAVLSTFGDVRLRGSMGDPTGVERYRAISAEPLDKWRRQLASPWRKRWCRDWLRRIGGERLSAIGYDLDGLLTDLDDLPNDPRKLASDAVYGTYWTVAQRRKRAAFRRMAPRVR